MPKIYVNFDEWRDFPCIHEEKEYGDTELEATEEECRLFKLIFGATDCVVDLIKRKLKEQYI